MSRNGNTNGHKTIGELIKAARKRRKLRADDVAKLCNLSRARVYQLEAGTFVMPKNLKRLSEVLGVPLKRLQDSNGKRPS